MQGYGPGFSGAGPRRQVGAPGPNDGGGGRPAAPQTPFRNLTKWQGTQVNVVTAGAPVQGPDIPIPDGIALMIRAKDANGNNIYYQASQAAVLDSRQRLVLIPGAAITMYVTNARLFWFDAVVSGDGVEIVSEQM